jgi:hypothetical protein
MIMHIISVFHIVTAVTGEGGPFTDVTGEFAEEAVGGGVNPFASIEPAPFEIVGATRVRQDKTG